MMHLLCKLPWRSSPERQGQQTRLQSSSPASTSIRPEVPSEQKGRLGLTPLSLPEDPDIDLVFVHGLGGDSRKTWGSTDGQPACWPRDWLPKEPGFERVRIQTFGYDTKFLKGPGNCLNIHHLGKLLLGELETSPTLGQSKTRIVFIAHSMGGLVVKKTFLLAKQDPTYHVLANRIDTIVFLACPHHGADSAKLLRRVLSPVYDRQYLADLERGSSTLQLINNEFRRYAEEVSLWSFYETQKMKLWSSLVVDESSAVLNYPEEKQRPMPADHRSICKFDSPTAPNYLTIRNSISYIVNNARTSLLENDLRHLADQTRPLRGLLGYAAFPDDTLDALIEKREPDTCDWILSTKAFMEWSSEAAHDSPILWISGKPGWGKSTLASFIVESLSKTGSEVHSYFFHFSDNRKATAEDCLRSLSYQIALCSSSCRETFLRMFDEGVRLEGTEARPFWKAILSSGCLQGVKGQQHLVLDGLDECNEPHVVLETLAQLFDEDLSADFRLLVIGRELPSLSRSFSKIKAEKFRHLRLETIHTSEGISRVIQRRIPFIPAIKDKDQAHVAARILEQSQGSFLFADLVLRDLSNCHDPIDVSRTLETLPVGMEPVYGRIVDEIARIASSRHLTHAILSWIICVSRPLTIDELQTALEIDLGTTFHNFGATVVSLCGQLVSVDQIGRVRLQHETARHFLLSQQQREDFTFDEGEGHSGIARVCFRLFSQRQFRRAIMSGTNLTSDRGLSGFDLYALLEFPLHLSKASVDPASLAEPAARFFKLHVLDWIYFVVGNKGLSLLDITSKQLGLFCTRLQGQTVDSRSMRYLSQLANDLPHLIQKFGSALLFDPSSVYTSIPHFCPSESTIYKARKQNSEFRTVGDLGTQWDGATASLALTRTALMAASRGSYFAILLRGGAIYAYDTADYKLYRSFDHGTEANHIAFNDTGQLLASSGEGCTKVWNFLQGNCIREFHHEGVECLGLEFDGDRLLTPRRDDLCHAWSLVNNQQEKTLTEPQFQLSDNKFLRVSISVVSRLIISQSHDATVLDLDTGEFINSCAFPMPEHNERDAIIQSMVIHPVNGTLALAHTYELLTLEPRDGEVLQRRACRTTLLATSSDGRFLAATERGYNVSVVVKLFEFQSLALLHVVETGTNDIEILSFAKNDSHLVGIHGYTARQAKVWEIPEDLAQSRNFREMNSKSQGRIEPTPPRGNGPKKPCDTAELLAPPDEDFILCAGLDGQIGMFDKSSGDFKGMFLALSCPIRSLTWWPRHRAVLCLGYDNVLTLKTLPPLKSGGDPGSGSLLFQCQVPTKSWIYNVSVANDSGVVLVSDFVMTYWYSDKGELLGTVVFHEDDRNFVILPEAPYQALCFCHYTGVHIYDIENWARPPKPTAITRFVVWPLRRSIYAGLGWKHNVHLSPTHRTVFLQGRVLPGMHGPKGMIIKLDIDTIISDQDAYASPPPSPSEGSAPTTPVWYSELFNVPIHRIIGVVEEGDTVIFIDEAMWVSSLNVRTTQPVSSRTGCNGSTVAVPSSYNRHFFLPTDFFRGDDVELSCVIVGDDLALGIDGRPLLVKGFLKLKSEVQFDSYASLELLAVTEWVVPSDE